MRTTDPATMALKERPKESHTRPRRLAVSLDVAAEMLSVSTKTVRREIDRGHLRAVRIGRLWRVPTSELEAYLRRRQTRPQNGA